VTNFNRWGGGGCRNPHVQRAITGVDREKYAYGRKVPEGKGEGVKAVSPVQA